jgi:hypothetical protein
MPFEQKPNGWRDWQSGDLIYGVADARTALMKHFRKQSGKSDLGWSTIDQFDLGDNGLNGSGLKYDRDFIEALKSHPKYQSAVGKKLDWDAKRGITDHDQPELEKHGSAAAVTAVADAKRKCKGGLDYITRYTTKHIHFCLDEIVMDTVVNKSYASKRAVDLPVGKSNRDQYDKVRSVTGSELRWVYRNRFDQRVAQGIQFWFNDAQCPAPWLDNNHSDWIDAWKQYHPATEWSP